MSSLIKQGVTLLELMVVVMIIGILSSIAVTVYTGQVERARYAAARDTIRQLELAITRYEVDTGQYPPSSSGLLLAPYDIDYIISPTEGCGYLQVALLHSLSGDVLHPLDLHWNGPYLEIDTEQLGTRTGEPLTGSVPKPEVQILDPWGSPYYYTRSDDYPFGGTRRPPTDPYHDTETYYNPTTYQIFSMGANGTTLRGGVVNIWDQRGLEPDDVNNW